MKSSKRSYIFGAISILLLFLFLELIGRLALFIMKYPFWQPSNKFYPELQTILQADIAENNDTYDILILGGSAMSLEFGGQINKTLDSLLHLSNPKVKIYNAATPAHTSLDNLYKYKMLADKHFDLVIFYEAINENRFNNIPPKDFSDDYQHILWYYDMALMNRHPEVNWTVLPFIAHKSINLLIDKLKGKKFLNFQEINPDYIQYGSDIKTAKAYRQNVEGIIKEAQAKKEKILLMTYALYVPQSVIGNGGYTDYRDFATCKYPSPLWLWGDPINVRQGVQVHNDVIRQLAAQYHTFLFDMDQQMPRQKDYYCDLCHLSDNGSRIFAQNLYKYLNDSNLTRKN